MIASQLVGTKRPSTILSPCGVCIQELPARIQKALTCVPKATAQVAAKCNRGPTRFIPNSMTPRKPGLEEERRHRFVGQQRPEDRAHLVGIAGPVEAELVAHDQARDDADPEDDREDLQPEPIGVEINGLLVQSQPPRAPQDTSQDRSR